MPSVSSKQEHFMQMSRSPEGRARLRRFGSKPAPVEVAKEFVKADKKTKGLRRLKRQP